MIDTPSQLWRLLVHEVIERRILLALRVGLPRRMFDLLRELPICNPMSTVGFEGNDGKP
jgi:hypothetical protein